MCAQAHSPKIAYQKPGLGGRLMVGQVPLEHFVQVRILAAQPKLQVSEVSSVSQVAHGRNSGYVECSWPAKHQKPPQTFET